MHSRPCFSVFDLPPQIKGRYRRMALISRLEHVARLDESDTDTLVVACNWLLWQQMTAAGRHCVYYEFGLLGWVPDDKLTRDLFIRANDWIPIDGVGDPTVFRNVSLARLFSPEISMFLRNYYRLDRALRKLIDRFRPEEIWFFDFIYDVNVMSVSVRKLLVEEVARDRKVALVDRSGEVPEDAHAIAEAVYTPRGHGPVARAILAFYGWFLETVTRVRCAVAPASKRIFLLVNANMAEPLLRNFSGGGLTPVFFGRTVPRKLRFLWHCFRRGVLLVTPKPQPLTADDATRLRDIHAALDAAFSMPTSGEIGFVRAYVRRVILDAGRFEKMAAEVATAERLFDRVRPQRVVVDGVRNIPPRVYIELARNRGIAVDYIWHSPHTPQNLKYDALGGDPNYHRCVTRCLSWGRLNERWLDQVDAPLSRVRVGSPLANKYSGVKSGKPSNAAAPNQRNVLLLQYTFNLSDFAGLNANMYGSFVNTVRELRRLGYVNVRFKLHPGRGRWKKEYFETIADYFGLDCPVLKSEPYQECLAWADVVVGSVLTGAMFETLAAGIPYHALLLSPHSMDTSYYEGFPLVTALNQLPQVLGRNIEKESRKLLDDLYSIEEIENPSLRLWDVLRGDFR